MYRIKNKSILGVKGNITVEAALIIPFLILIIYMLMFCCMILYQKVFLNSTVVYAVQQGAEVWNDSRKSMENSSWDRSGESDGLYSILLNDGSVSFNETFEGKVNFKASKASGLGQKKLELVKKALYDKLGRSLVTPLSTKVYIGYDRSFFTGTLNISIEQKIKAPLSWLPGISAIFAISVKARSSASVENPAELIRNIDLGLEYASNAAKTLKLKEKLKSIQDTISQKAK